VFFAIDLGNSQTSFGVFDESGLQHHWSLETKPSRTSDEFASFLLPLIKHVDLTKVSWEGVALCSVVPSANRAISEFCQQYLKHSPFQISASQDLGVGFNVDMPSEVGADRIANASYALAHLKLPSIIVDFGTATTFDVISEGGVYEGGPIVPGIRMSLQALGEKTAKLPFVDLQFPEKVIGKNTVECIQGLLYGYCDLVDGLLTRIEDEISKPTDIVLTGGHASLFQKHLKHSVQVLPNLTLEGIQLLYQYAKESQ